MAQGFLVVIVKLALKQDELKKNGNKLSDKLSNIVDDIHSFENNIHKQEAIIDSLETQKDDAEESLSDLEISFSAILDKIYFVENELERISAEQQSVDTRKTKASENKKQASDSFSKLRVERDELFQKLGEMRVKLETERASLKSTETDIERLLVSSAQNEYKTKEIMLEVQKNNQMISDYEQNVSDIMATSAFSSSAKKVELVREKISVVVEDKKKCQSKMNEADGNKMLLTGEIQRASDKKAKEENHIVKIDTELENLQTRVWEQYQMTYADAKSQVVENFDIKSGSEEATEIKRKISRLGNVNLSAIEDIKMISERYDDMAKQRDDLEKAKADLETIIKDLTTRMEEKFRNRFNLR